MTDDESQGRASVYRTGRMEAFSDGVFAIALAGVQIVDVCWREDLDPVSPLKLVS